MWNMPYYVDSLLKGSSMAGSPEATARRGDRCPACGAFHPPTSPHPKAGPKMRSIQERIARYAVPDGECLRWPTPKGRRPQTSWFGEKMYVARALWMEVHGPVPDEIMVRHKCDNLQCVSLDHLEIGTRQDNMDDMVDRSRSPRGERNSQAKLTVEEVRAIFLDPRNAAEVAAEYHVDRRQINRIRNGDRWGWATADLKTWSR